MLTFLKYLAQIFVRRAGICGGFQHHEHPLSQMPRDAPASIEDVRYVGFAILVERRGDTNNDRVHFPDTAEVGRSEERRVGQKCRSRWAPDHLKKKIQKGRRKQNHAPGEDQERQGLQTYSLT